MQFIKYIHCYRVKPSKPIIHFLKTLKIAFIILNLNEKLVSAKLIMFGENFRVYF